MPSILFRRRHSSSPSYRYLHSAVVLHGVMLVFGGNTHNDTSFSQVGGKKTLNLKKKMRISSIRIVKKIF